MFRPTQIPSLARQQGIALVITLVLLLVMTMIAVVAMRATTIDLKMTTNTVLQRRAFQSSEGARTAIRRVIASHMYYGGWPANLVGGSGFGNYDIPPEVGIVNTAAHFDTDINGKLADIGPPTFSRDPDIRYRQDVNDDGVPDNTDMFADIWVTFLGTRICAGCSAQTNASTTGNSAANGGSHTFLDIRASGLAPGNAQQLTSAEFRALVK